MKQQVQPLRLLPIICSCKNIQTIFFTYKITFLAPAKIDSYLLSTVLVELSETVNYSRNLPTKLISSRPSANKLFQKSFSEATSL